LSCPQDLPQTGARSPDPYRNEVGDITSVVSPQPLDLKIFNLIFIYYFFSSPPDWGLLSNVLIFSISSSPGRTPKGVPIPPPGVLPDAPPNRTPLKRLLRRAKEERKFHFLSYPASPYMSLSLRSNSFIAK
jgi:hypothetical protein